jgi:hypothetical protein
MNIESKSKLKKQLPYWVFLLIGVIATSLLANFLSIFFQTGGFKTWKSLSTPPSQATHIIHADTNVVWVETENSEIFALTVNCYRENCFQWLKTEDIPDPFAYMTLYRGTNCASLHTEQFLPLSPFGKEIECVKVDELGVEYGTVSYFALMADGTLMYWENTISIFSMQFFSAFFTYILAFFVAIIISVIYLIRNIIKRIRINATLPAG